jgi:hypothetical protein
MKTNHVFMLVLFIVGFAGVVIFNVATYSGEKTRENAALQTTIQSLEATASAPATSTPRPTSTRNPSATPSPTQTFTPSPTWTPVVVTATPSPTLTPQSVSFGTGCAAVTNGDPVMIFDAPSLNPQVISRVDNGTPVWLRARELVGSLYYYQLQDGFGQYGWVTGLSVEFDENSPNCNFENQSLMSVTPTPIVGTTLFGYQGCFGTVEANNAPMFTGRDLAIRFEERLNHGQEIFLIAFFMDTYQALSQTGYLFYVRDADVEVSQACFGWLWDSPMYQTTPVPMNSSATPVNGLPSMENRIQPQPTYTPTPTVVAHEQGCLAVTLASNAPIFDIEANRVRSAGSNGTPIWVLARTTGNYPVFVPESVMEPQPTPEAGATEVSVYVHPFDTVWIQVYSWGEYLWMREQDLTIPEGCVLGDWLQ